MPAAVAGIVVASAINAGVTSLIAAQLIYAAAYIATSAILSFAANLVLGALSKPKSASLGGGFTSLAANRTVNLKQPVEPWHIVYGNIRKAGIYTYIDVSGADNQFIHLVVTLSGHQVSRIGAMYFDGEYVPINGSGEVVTGEFSGKVLVEKNLGYFNQEAFPELRVDKPDAWTETDTQSGRAGVHIRLKYDDTVFANGVPAIAFDIDGKAIFDNREAQLTIVSSVPDTTGFIILTTTTPHGFAANDPIFIYDSIGTTFNLNGERFVDTVNSPTEVRVFIGATSVLDATSTTGSVSKMIYSANTDLCINDYLGNRFYGMSYDYGVEISPTSLTTAANVDDEYVALTEEGNSFAITFSGSDATIGEQFFQLATADQINFTTTDVLPAELSVGTDYYWIRFNETEGMVALTPEDAYARIPIVTTDDGTGAHTIVRNAELRYTTNGSFKADQTPFDIIREMLTANGGKVTFIGGLWRFLPAYYRPPTVELTDSDFRGAGFSTVTTFTARDSFNAVKGVYASPQNKWQPADYPGVTNALYLEQDNGERRWKDLDLPWTTSSSRAQRISKIDLEKGRQEITIPVLQCKLVAYQVQAGDTIMLTIPDYGWDQKVFDVISSDLVVNSDDETGATTLGVDLSLQEAASESYDWNAGEETITDPAPNTTLPDTFSAAPPSDLQVVESLFVSTTSSGVKVRVIVSWTASPDAFITSYQTQFKLSADVDWTDLPLVPGTSITINDVTPGLYDFRVRAISNIGKVSEYITGTQEITGLLTPPVIPTGLTLEKAGGIAILRWDAATDLDVRQGGTVNFRHVTEGYTVSLANSVTIGSNVAGADTLGLLPLRPGTYLVRFVDSSGVSGPFATVVTDGAQVIAFAPVDTVIEDPAWSGTNSGTVILSSTLRLGGASPIDDWGLVDDIADWDYEGGVVSSGIYTFATGMDMSSVQRFRLRPVIESFVINQLDLIDDRTQNIDLWDNFDGVAGSEGDVQIWARTTNTDPNGSPVWGPYERLDSSEYEAWGVQFQARLSVIDTSYNIVVQKLSVIAEETI